LNPPGPVICSAVRFYGRILGLEQDSGNAAVKISFDSVFWNPDEYIGDFVSDDNCYNNVFNFVWRNFILSSFVRLSKLSLNCCYIILFKSTISL